MKRKKKKEKKEQKKDEKIRSKCEGEKLRKRREDRSKEDREESTKTHQVASDGQIRPVRPLSISFFFLFSSLLFFSLEVKVGSRRECHTHVEKSPWTNVAQFLSRIVRLSVEHEREKNVSCSSRICPSFFFHREHGLVSLSIVETCTERRLVRVRWLTTGGGIDRSWRIRVTRSMKNLSLFDEVLLFLDSRFVWPPSSHFSSESRRDGTLFVTGFRGTRVLMIHVRISNRDREIFRALVCLIWFLWVKGYRVILINWDINPQIVSLGYKLLKLWLFDFVLYFIMLRDIEISSEIWCFTHNIFLG